MTVTEMEVEGESGVKDAKAQLAERMEQLNLILTGWFHGSRYWFGLCGLAGEPSITLYLEFLYRNNRSDPLILKKIKVGCMCFVELPLKPPFKETVNEKNSVLHSATVFANSIMHAGTTCDNFLRLL